MVTEELQSLKSRYDIVGNDVALNRALETAVAVAPTDIPVLITGESGVGKENFSKIIRDHSLRKTAPFFAVNCGAIPEGTVDSELFGHEKGSFTGAISTRKGYFEEADGGTLFLDEVGELPMASQAKLLRVLQNGEYMKVGSSKVEKTDVRVIAATNVDLLHAVSKGKFRADLYYRLNAVQVRVPALRERKSDIYLLFRKFASDFVYKYHLRRISLTRAACQKLTDYPWPGNVRQLKNVAEAIAALESSPVTPMSDSPIEIDEFALESRLPQNSGEVALVSVDTPSGNASAEDSMSAVEKRAIVSAIMTQNAELEKLKAEVSHIKSLLAGFASADTSVPAVVGHQGHGVKPQDDIEDQTFEPETQDHYAEEQSQVEPLQESPASLGDIKKVTVKKTLEEFHGNRRKAAAKLGISERTLYRLINKYGLSI